MSEFDYDDEYGNAPKALRDHAKALEKQLADLQKKFEDAEKARAAAEKAAKSQTLTSILRDKGIKPQLAKWLEKDEVEASPEAVDAWLTENGEFFNVKPAQAEPVADADQEDHDDVDPELAAAIRAGQQLDASGVSPSAVGVEQKLQSIDASKAESFDDLLNAMKQAGIELQ